MRRRLRPQQIPRCLLRLPLLQLPRRKAPTPGLRRPLVALRLHRALPAGRQPLAPEAVAPICRWPVALRTLLLEAGFGPVTGLLKRERGTAPGMPSGSHPPVGGPRPSRRGAVHHEVPHHGGGSAPGFLLLLTLPRSVVLPVRVVVGGVEFRPNDGGIERDAVGGDGIWTTMVERYPGGTALEVFAGDALLGTAPIELRSTDDIPELALTLP